MNKYILCILLTTVSLQADMQLTSSAFKHDGMIPAKYTCDGENVSPPLEWSGAPSNTKSFALIVDDPDAPTKIWVHWIVYNIMPDTTRFPENVVFTVEKQGVTDFNGAKKYGGPCPPDGVHNYHFTLYALDSIVSLPSDADKTNVLQVMDGHILAQTTLIGRYQKKQ